VLDTAVRCACLPFERNNASMSDSRFNLLGRDMAVDLGTANTLVYVRGRASS